MTHAFKYEPGHSSGDGCQWPTIGHIVRAKVCQHPAESVVDGECQACHARGGYVEDTNPLPLIESDNGHIIPGMYSKGIARSAADLRAIDESGHFLYAPQSHHRYQPSPDSEPRG